MQLSPPLVEELKRILLEQFGSEVSFEDAEEIGVGLVELYRLIVKLQN